MEKLMKIMTPTIFFTVSYTVSTLWLGPRATVPVLLVHAVLIPLAFRFCKPVQQKLVFFNLWSWPPSTTLKHPETHGMQGTRNFYITHRSRVDNTDIKIGVWHILPAALLSGFMPKLSGASDDGHKSKLFEEQLTSSGHPVVLYCHGNSNNRAASHRIKLYKVLQDLNVHTITFDYRGYGDSSAARPTERGVVEDALAAYAWLVGAAEAGRPAPAPALYVWGHSLGTGISSHMLGNLTELCHSHLDGAEVLPMPKGLILEAPFNNLADEIACHPASKLVSWLPYHRAMFVQPFVACEDYRFQTDAHLARARALPLLLLHAKDDGIVPHQLGLKLCNAVVSSRGGRGAPVTLLSYESAENLGHKWICNAPGLPATIRDFMSGRLPAQPDPPT